MVDEIMLARPVTCAEDADVGGIDTASTVAAAIGSLRVDDRELLVLSAWLELSPSEIAEVLGVPAGRVRVRLHRLRAALRRELGQQEEGDLA